MTGGGRADEQVARGGRAEAVRERMEVFRQWFLIADWAVKRAFPALNAW